MLIRKEFKFNNMHIVRNCTSTRCSQNLHAHTYKVEIYITGGALDNGRMVVDFGLLKSNVKELIKAFDNSYTFWSEDQHNLIQLVRNHNKRTITVPKSPSAEVFSMIFFKFINLILKSTEFKNNESDIALYKVRVHETRTGWAEFTSFDEAAIDDADDFKLKDIVFSSELIESNPEFYTKLADVIKYEDNVEALETIKFFINPKPNLMNKGSK